jgi:hypothetical protein
LTFSFDQTSQKSKHIFLVLVSLLGLATGAIGGLFYRYGGGQYCLTAISLGTLYWFFYGTAFVIGLLEIIAGELLTGVTRFVAVSVKTFVLCLGCSQGLQAVSADVAQVWLEQQENCSADFDISTQWFRLPLYTLCAATCLGQYRFPIADYWRGLVTLSCLKPHTDLRSRLSARDRNAPPVVCAGGTGGGL